MFYNKQFWQVQAKKELASYIENCKPLVEFVVQGKSSKLLYDIYLGKTESKRSVLLIKSIFWNIINPGRCMTSAETKRSVINCSDNSHFFTKQFATFYILFLCLFLFFQSCCTKSTLKRQRGWYLLFLLISSFRFASLLPREIFFLFGL